MTENYSRPLLHAIAIAIALVVWEVSVSGSPRALFLFGSPLAVVNVAWDELREGRIFMDILITGQVVVLGLLAGTVVGAGSAFGMWVNPRIAEFFLPYIVMATAVPIFALAPMLIIWFGVGAPAKIVMSSFAVTLVTLVGTYNLVREAHRSHDEWMIGLAMTRWQRLRFVLGPVAVSGILEIMSKSVGVSVVATFIGEFIASQAGLGRYVLQAGGLFDVPRVLFGILLLATITLVLSSLIARIAGQGASESTSGQSS